ncbi:MAG: hypothetical protein D3914_12395 [Candidatus Electrothrix sp. LOE2]|nr:hypothetical protein [Candidatus Electrothrix sp. LOE2]
MSEFNNRIDAQRDILGIVNRQTDYSEELCGLSKKAIERWISSNQLNPKSETCDILFQIAKKLFFLANKSQEQITEDYKALSSEISLLKTNLEKSI